MTHEAFETFCQWSDNIGRRRGIPLPRRRCDDQWLMMAAAPARRPMDVSLVISTMNIAVAKNHSIAPDTCTQKTEK